MNRPETFLAFRKNIDDLRDEAIERNDVELLDGLAWVEAKSKKDGKEYYHYIHEILARSYLG